MEPSEKIETSGSAKGTTGVGAAGWATLTVCTLLYILNFMDRQVISTVLQPMKVALGLTDTQAGTLATVFSIGAAVFAWPVGMLIDRWSRTKSIGIMALLWSIATFFTGLGRNFIGILIPRSLVGIGESGYSPGATALITARFPAKMRSRVQSVYVLGMPIGMILGTALGGYLSAKFGWQTPFYYFAIPGVILGIIAFFLKDYKTVQTADKASRRNFWQTTGHLFKIPTLVWLYLGVGFLNTLSFAFMSWMPAFMMRSMNIGEDKAGLLMALIAVAAFVGSLVGGWIADMWYRKNARSRLHMGWLASLLCMITFVPGVLLMGAGQMVASLVILFIFGMGIVMLYPAIQVATQEVVHPSMKGISFGMYAVFVFIFSAPGPLVVGAISDALGGGVAGLQTALLVPSALLLLSILFFWLGSRSYMADADKVKNVQVEF